MSDAFVTFPGLPQGLHVDFSGTVGLGVQPGRFVIRVPQGVPVENDGDLVFGDGRRPPVTIPGCRRVDARWQGSTYVVTLEDRRWRWRTGAVFGDYNATQDGTDALVREQTPQQLAALLWAQMNETGLDATALPTDDRPRADWYAANPASELDSLITQLGCVLAPQLDSSWRVYPIGEGPLYAALATDRISAELSQTFAGYPDQVAVVCGPNDYEAVFTLEAVGEEADGSIVPIDQLSYRPAGGWAEEGLGFHGVVEDFDRDGTRVNNRDLAVRSVYRWYRVKGVPGATGGPEATPADYEPLATVAAGAVVALPNATPFDPARNYNLPNLVLHEGAVFLNRVTPVLAGPAFDPSEWELLGVPGAQFRRNNQPAGGTFASQFDPLSFNPPDWNGDDIASLADLLPLVNAVNRKDERTSSPNFGKRDVARVWGRFQKDPILDTTSRPGSPVRESFSLDAEKGIVRFSAPVVLVEKGFYSPAELFLQCVVRPLDKTGKPRFFSRFLDSGQNLGTGAEVIRRDDLHYQTRPQWRPAGNAEGVVSNNLASLEPRLLNALASYAPRFQPTINGTLQLVGIHAPQLNGRQTSVRWAFGTRSAPRTTIGVGVQVNPHSTSFEDERRAKLREAEAAAQARLGRRRLAAEGRL